MSEKPPSTQLERVQERVHEIGRAFDFTTEQRKIIRDSFASGASEEEFAMLLEVARVRRLNPLLRQIHFVKRNQKDERTDQWKEVWTFLVAIDGQRAIAERTDQYDGQEEPEIAFDDKKKLLSVKVKVFRKDKKYPFVGLAMYDEFVQTKRDGSPNSMWAKMPVNQLTKCAEALALRKAFPEELGGIFAPEEFGDDDRPSGAERFAAAPVQPAAAPGALAPPAPAAVVDKVVHWTARIRATTTKAAKTKLATELAKEAFTASEREAIGAVYKAHDPDAQGKLPIDSTAVPGEPPEPGSDG